MSRFTIKLNSWGLRLIPKSYNTAMSTGKEYHELVLDLLEQNSSEIKDMKKDVNKELSDLKTDFTKQCSEIKEDIAELES